MKRSLWLAVGLLVLALPCAAAACNICGALRNRLSFREEMAEATVVLYGTAANPRFNTDPKQPDGTGSTDFHIAAVLKSAPALGGQKTIVLPRYIPVLDPKNPPKFVIFCNVRNGKLFTYEGRTIRSEVALLKYLEEAKSVQGKDRTAALLFYFRYLDHEDEVVAQDAFQEFARSSDQEVAQAAKFLPPDRLRRLLENPKTPSERIGLYAFLLGVVGTEKDAEFLKGLIDRPTERNVNALDGLLAGYVQLRGRAGWDVVVALLADSKRTYNERFAAARTLRFYQAWKPAEAKEHILRGLAVLVADGDLADLGIEDLRKHKLWDLTDLVLAQYGKASHDTPIIQRGVVRYALDCAAQKGPASAAAFVAAVRRQNPDLVRELEEGLAFEKQNP
jgi:hypothetical protein